MRLSFKTAAPRAPGYPKTNDVTAKKLKGTSVIIVKNGSNLFRLPALTFSKISVGAGENGAFNLLGTNESAETTLASFGSLKGANNALDRVSSVYAGLGAGVRWVRLSLCLIAAYALVSVFSGAVMTSTAAAAAARSSQPTTLRAPAQLQGRGPADAAAVQVAHAPAGFNPNEQSLEELQRLANGGQYKFEPKLAMPNVEAPVLDCAPHPAK